MCMCMCMCMHRQVRGGAPLYDLEAECAVELQPAIFGPPDATRDVIVWHRVKDVRTPNTLAYLPLWPRPIHIYTHPTPLSPSGFALTLAVLSYRLPKSEFASLP